MGYARISSSGPNEMIHYRTFGRMVNNTIYD